MISVTYFKKARMIGLLGLSLYSDTEKLLSFFFPTEDNAYFIRKIYH